ncbi:MAG: M1 family metallopeptidase [Bacteroidia bacterium]|nr:M1 family metallopeptidase [Bacteroidia bacterium]
MNKIFSLVFLLFITPFVFAQNRFNKLNQANWQQHVSYKIEVKLADETNTLIGNISMVYTNNSPKELNEIYMHLWPNAYSSRNTAFAKQHLENGKTDFYFAKPEEQGSIDSLNFKVNNTRINWKLTNDVDIALLTLNEPLKPGQNITISTPFYVFLPKVYSRMGHEKQLYCITQWFPKPAVFDVNGWNPIPYLDQGEFYSEFGSFDVSISVPKNYVVAATGNLQNEEEKLFLNDLATKSPVEFEVPPISSNEFKTLRYVQDSVHDFAWFASKEFNVKKGEIALQNGKTIETWLFAKKINAFGINYINEGVKYYSDHIGNYPYNLAQVVITPLEAGGGMEYPTITNCASIDRTTIIHEVGHNWFYGILGSNEREYPWMDESLNTYYESRCTQEKKDADIAKNGKKKDVLKDVFNVNLEGFGQARLLYAIAARKNEDQAGNLPSTTYTDFNYGAIIYAKNPLSFYMLQNYLGNEIFDSMMHAYYEKWKFKHPLPNDFKNHAETFTGKDLSWFFEDVLGSTQKMDYKIVGHTKDSVTIRNKTSLVVPFSVSDNKNNTLLSEGFEGTKKFRNSNFEIRNLVIDQKNTSIDLYRQNNSLKKPISIRFLPALEDPNKRQMFCIPLYAWNNYNQSMLGIHLSNDVFPLPKTEISFTPLYSFTTNDWNGYLNLAKNIFPKHGTTYKKVKIGLNMSRFATIGLYNNNGLAKLTYEKFAPFIELHFNQKTARSLFSNVLNFRHVTILENPQNSGYFNNWDNQSISAFDITHRFKHDMKVYPSAANVNLQVGTFNYNYGRISADFTQGILYKDKGKTASIRLFAGTFLGNQSTNNYTDFSQSRSYFRAGGTTGQFDYFYDETMFGRAEQNPQQTWMARQIINRDAGFRNFVNIGSSNTWLTSANLTIPFPFKLPIGFYSDVVFWEELSNASQSNLTAYETKLTYSGGLYLSIAKNIFQLYLPLFASKDVEDAWKSADLNHPFERASFILNLNALNPVKIIKEAKL